MSSGRRPRYPEVCAREGLGTFRMSSCLFLREMTGTTPALFRFSLISFSHALEQTFPLLSAFFGTNLFWFLAADHSIIRSVNHSFIQSIGQSFIQSFDQSIIHSINQSVNHSFNHSISQSFIQSFDQSIIHSIIRSVNHSFNHLINHSFNHLTIHSFNHSII